MGRFLGATAGNRYARSHSYKDYLAYVADQDKNNSWQSGKNPFNGKSFKPGDYRKGFMSQAESQYEKNGQRQKYYDEKPFREEAERLNAESLANETNKQQATSDASGGLGSQTLSEGDTMLTSGEGATLAENEGAKKKKSLLGG